MQFLEQLNWADGQFLQPHHFQYLQHNFYESLRGERAFFLPFSYGLIEFSIDQDALLSRRIVVNRLSALMPNGEELSYPGNCTIEPLTLDKPNSHSEGTFSVYLALPQYSNSDANLAEDNKKGLYSLRERNVYDENTGDNETIIITRSKNVKLVTDLTKISNSSVLRLLKLKWISYQGQEPVLDIDKSYMPPFILLTPDCPISSLINELLFLLQTSKEHLIETLEKAKIEARSLPSNALFNVMQLNILSEAQTRMVNLLRPYKTTVFHLYLEVATLLSKLQALDFSKGFDDCIAYNHDDVLPSFKVMLDRIRSLLLAESNVSFFTRIDFVTTEESRFLVAILDEVSFSEDSEFYLALNINNRSESTLDELLAGDNFRVVDTVSADSRVRGFRLTSNRFPPRQLPIIPGALWFKVETNANLNLFEQVKRDKVLIIDRSTKSFENLKAVLFILNKVA